MAITSVSVDANKDYWEMVSAIATSAAVCVALGIPIVQGIISKRDRKILESGRINDVATMLLPLFMRLRARLITMRHDLYEAQQQSRIHPAGYFSLQLSSTKLAERLLPNLELLPAEQRKHLATIIGWTSLWDESLKTMFVRINSSDFYDRVIDPDSRFQESLITPLLESSEAMLKWCMSITSPSEEFVSFRETMPTWPASEHAEPTDSDAYQ